jgi:hypothetical protein
VIEPFRVSTEAIRASVASLPDAGRRDLATALQALSQLVAVQDALGERFDESTVEVFGQGAVLLSYRVAQQQRTIQVVELLWLGLTQGVLDVNVCGGLANSLARWSGGVEVAAPGSGQRPGQPPGTQRGQAAVGVDRADRLPGWKYHLEGKLD